MDYLFVLVQSGNSYVLFVIKVVLLAHISLVNHLFVGLARLSLLFRLGFFSALDHSYGAEGSSYFGRLKEKFFLLRALDASWVSITRTWSPNPPFSLRGGKSQGICSFLH